MRTSSEYINRLFGIVLFTSLGAIASAFLLAFAGAPEEIVMAFVYVGGGAMVALFGAGFLLVLVAHLPRALYALLGPGKNRFNRFAIWAAHNMTQEDEPIAPEGVEPTRGEKIHGVVVFLFYYGFIFVLIASIVAQSM